MKFSTKLELTIQIKEKIWNKYLTNKTTDKLKFTDTLKFTEDNFYIFNFLLIYNPKIVTEAWVSESDSHLTSFVFFNLSIIQLKFQKTMRYEIIYTIL